jgi:cytochrome c peroxidase
MKPRRYVSSLVLTFVGGIAVVFLFRCRSSQPILTMGEIPNPSSNPMTEEKIELGRKLFFDKRLSRDESISCASCHVPSFAFTDRKKVSDGVGGGQTERNAPSLLNAAYLKTAMFDAHLATLEQQVIVPIQEHVEMDMRMKELIERLRNIPDYQKAAQEIFGRDFDAYVLTRSIAAFERTLVSQNSRFDQYMYQGKKNALSADEKKGWEIFSQKLYCTTCHPAPHFTTYVAENNGLYFDYGSDKGRFRIHNDSNDIGKFKVPSLRNIALTNPYMHDGSLRSLEEVLEHYAVGGKHNQRQHPSIISFQLSAIEKKQLVSFLQSLTDTSYMKRFR